MINNQNQQSNNQKPQPQREQINSSSFEFLKEMLRMLFWAALIIIPIRVFVFQPFFVQGASMEPNFYDGEYLIVNEWGYKQVDVFGLFTIGPYRELERGAPIVFRYPNNDKKYFIKRVVGLPGEKLVVRDNQIIVFNEDNPQGFYLDEDEYLPNSTKTLGKKEFDLGEMEYVVLGDNRTQSSDSRNWGKLSQEYVVGKVFFRAWPPRAAAYFE